MEEIKNWTTKIKCEQNALIECVPNFSEGRDMTIINQITDTIKRIEGVKLLDVDPGASTNRTVVTFVGHPQQVLRAALAAMEKAKELIDMTQHKGSHPRFGATDVCPLVPVANIDMDKVVEFARELAEEAGQRLQYPIFCYENAAMMPERKNLAKVRAGEYEGLGGRFESGEKPDFGPAKLVPQTGATAVGARDFLIAVNFNLNTTSTRRANSVAFDVREKGRVAKDEHGKAVKDEQGKKVWKEGKCKGTKAIGWMIEEYGFAQVSMNITNIQETPLHVAFEETRAAANNRGMRVTGTEIVGVVPKSVMVDAGKYYMKAQQRSAGCSEKELIRLAARALGLHDLKPFDPNTLIIEYMIEQKEDRPLRNSTIEQFVDETASESPAPGGGSIAAAVGAMAAALSSMVANISSHKKGLDKRWEFYSSIAEKAQDIKSQLLNAIDDDTRAFDSIAIARKLPKTTQEAIQKRNKAIHEANINAINVPFKVMQLSYQIMDLAQSMLEEGLQSSLSDAGVSATAALTAIKGAYMNVLINLQGQSQEVINQFKPPATELLQKATQREASLFNLFLTKLDS